MAAEHPGGMVDASIGAPADPPPKVVRQALEASEHLAGYPPSAGSVSFRGAAAAWLQRRFGVGVDPAHLAACVGTKEFIADLPHLLRLADPSRDTVLYPSVSYPTYAMGARLAGCRAVPVPVDDRWRLDLSAVDPADVDRAVCLWVNTPGNPAGGLDDLAELARWGRTHAVPVCSDECYIEFTWDALDGAGPVAPVAGTVPGRSLLEWGTSGLLAVHSLSKRSNLAGARVGFYAGDPELVHYLSEVRKHAGRVVAGPVQEAAVAAFDDDAHVDRQRRRYWDRLERLARVLAHLDVSVDLPGGGFYLWVRAPDGDAWALARELATRIGLLVAPGEFYGPSGADRVRIAAVVSDSELDLLEKRAG